LEYHVIDTYSVDYSPQSWQAEMIISQDTTPYNTI